MFYYCYYFCIYIIFDDKALEAWVDSFNLDAFIVRPFNNYGPRQNYKPPLAAVIPITMFNILNNKPPEIWSFFDIVTYFD